MELWEIVVLGVVQGVAEFLPISSSGHLVIIESILGGNVENLELNVALHFGTLLSILVVYRKDLFAVLLDRQLMAKIILATLPVVGTGLFLKSFIEQASTSALCAGAGLVVTAGLLFITLRLSTTNKNIQQICFVDAFVIGLFQAIAPMPGVSRSGSTIVGGLLMGVDRTTAANFSFFIAIPALLGATILTAKDLISEGTSGTPLPYIAIGTVVSFVIGVASLKFLLKVVAAGRIAWFGSYCLLLGVAVILASLTGWL